MKSEALACGRRPLPKPFPLQQHAPAAPQRTTNRKEADRLTEAIDEGYSHNWIIDNLPAASVTVDEIYQTTYYARGFLVGEKDAKGQHVLNNHVRIYVDYHQVSPVLELSLLLVMVMEGRGRDVSDRVDRPTQHDRPPYNKTQFSQLDAPNQEKFRVVGFRVRPFSINHRAEGGDGACVRADGRAFIDEGDRLSVLCSKTHTHTPSLAASI